MPRFRSAGQDEGGETGIDISPLMDCVFILLIFFIVTTTFVEESGIEVNKPEASAGSNDEKTSITLIVSPSGKVTYEGREISLKAIANTVRRELQRKSDLPVIVTTEPGTRSGPMVRVVDAAKLGGAQADKISLNRK